MGVAGMIGCAVVQCFSAVSPALAAGGWLECDSACVESGGCDAACDRSLLGGGGLTCCDTAGSGGQCSGGQCGCFGGLAGGGDRSATACGALARLDLLGCIRPSDHCFDDFISPMINFVYFEDPRTLTELRPIFVNHWLPDPAGPAGLAAGGTAQLYAMQFRIALTRRLSLIATKDGYIVENIGDGPVDNLIDDGWADVAVGLKYNLIRDARRGTLGSLGVTYEIPMGDEDAAQSIGDGEFHLFMSGGQRLLGGNAHLLSGFGYRLPVDDDLQSAAVHWSNHFDVRLTDRTYLFTELAWWHWTDAADQGFAIGISGQDLFNLSASDVEENDLVTQNVGMKFKPRRDVEAGIAYEFPLTEFKDIIDDRLQLELILRY